MFYGGGIIAFTLGLRNAFNARFIHGIWSFFACRVFLYAGPLSGMAEASTDLSSGLAFGEYGSSCARGSKTVKKGLKGRRARDVV